MQTWVEELTKQYSAEEIKLKKYRDTLDEKDPVEGEEFDTVSGMISDMRFALTWMRRGRRPGSLRGVDRRKVYQRNAVATMLDDEKLKMLDLLMLLTKRERQCYLFHFSQGLTIREIADILEVSKGTAQTFLKRAKCKLQQEIM